MKARKARAHNPKRVFQEKIRDKYGPIGPHVAFHVYVDLEYFQASGQSVKPISLTIRRDNKRGLDKKTISCILEFNRLSVLFVKSDVDVYVDTSLFIRGPKSLSL